MAGGLPEPILISELVHLDHITIAGQTVEFRHVFYTWMAMLILFVVGWLVRRNISLIPGKMQNIFESIIGGLEDFTVTNMGEDGRKVFPVLGGLFQSLHNHYQYPSGNLDNEVKYFLEQAVEASKLVADKYKGNLTENTGVLQQSADDPSNPYFDMFAQEDLSDVKEVLLWRQYARGLSTHNINAAAGRGNYRIGLTRGFVQNFLMKDGTPVYAHGSYADGDGYYMGDKTVADVRVNRDPRLSIFLKEPGQKNILFEVDNNEGTEVVMEEPYPAITSGDGERGYATGYALRKGGSFNRKYYANGGGYTAAVCFRAAEALLN